LLRYFTKRQRIGILSLFFFVFLMQIILIFASYNEFITHQLDKNTFTNLEQEYDSLQQNHLKKKTPKRFPFNPNFISSYKGYELGMSLKEIELLHNFRTGNNWINSAQDFQRITGVSDSLLAAISPYFKFPKWVTQSQKQIKSKPQKKSKLDLNSATAQQLEKVYGIGPKLSERIIRYREKFNGGFADMVELKAVYGLSQEVIENIREIFKIEHPRPIQRLNLNTAGQEDFVKIPFIDYELAHNIVEMRTLKETYNSIEELTKLKDFPVEKLDIISLYLYVN